MAGYGYREREGKLAPVECSEELSMPTDSHLGVGLVLQELLWIARAGLKEPVPEGWKPW
jgi:hypothetical protein